MFYVLLHVSSPVIFLFDSGTCWKKMHRKSRKKTKKTHIMEKQAGL